MIEQLSLFEFKQDKQKPVITKPIRLIEFFAGYGAQHFGAEYLGANFESYKTCEWAVKSIQAYKDAHFKEDDTDYSKDLTKEQLIEYMANKGISADYNKPMTYEQIKRLSEDKLRTIYNNIKATHNLVNIQQVKGESLEIVDTDKYDYIITYSYPCITEDSLILTKDGYKEYRELNIGDYVLTKSNTWQKIAKKFDNGVHKTYYLHGMGFENIHCTANHKFYVREKYRKGHKGIRCFKEPVFKEVKDITKNDYFGVPVIQEEIPFYKDDLDFWYMIGYYLGDGWLSSSGNDIILACNDMKLEKLKSHLDFNKWHYTYHWNDSCYRFRFANKEIYEFISKYIGTGCFEKRICGEILNLPKAQLSALIDGYIDSDGCRIKKNIQFSSVNRGLIYGISSIINKVYHRTTCITKNVVNPKKNIQGRIVNQHDWYLLRFKPVDDIQDKAFYENGYLWYPFTKLVEDKEEHVYNMEIENDHSYIVQGCISKNCQDLSLAGKGAGMSKGSGTRSGMLWEVERILLELKELNQLPKVLIMENVPQVHGKKNLADFNNWIESLKEMGYTSEWKDLNCKNFCLPQNRNRTFMVSILGDTKFIFPEIFELKRRLKDILEKQVDEKYYLSDKIISKLAFKSDMPNDTTGIDLNDTHSITRDVASTIKARYDCGYEHFSPGPTGVIEPQLDIIAKTEDGNNFNTVYSENGISPTLLARDYKDPVRIGELNQLGQIYPNSGNPQAGRIYDKEGVSPCLDTCQGGNREVKIVESCSPLQKEVCNKALDFMQPNDTIDYTYSNSRLEEMEQGYIKTKNSEDNTIMNTLTTNAENFGICVEEPRICASRGRNPENPNSRGKGVHLEQRIELGPEGLSNTLTTVQKDNYLVEPKCIEHNITTMVKVRKYPVDTQSLCELLRERKSQLKYNNDYIAEQLNVPKTNVEHWFRNDEYFSIPTPDIWFKLKELLQIDTDKFNESITTFEEKESEFDMSNRAYEDNGISPTITTQGDANIVETNLKRQLCNKLIEQGKVTEGDVIRHSYTNSRFDSFHIENKESHDCCATIPTRADTLGVVEKNCPTLDTRCDCLGICVKDEPKLRNLRIRKLTPNECFRLMGVKDKDFEKIAENQSNASLYHLAGDSLITTIIMSILGELTGIEYRDKVENWKYEKEDK